MWNVTVDIFFFLFTIVITPISNFFEITTDNTIKMKSVDLWVETKIELASAVEIDALVINGLVFDSIDNNATIHINPEYLKVHFDQIMIRSQIFKDMYNDYVGTIKTIIMSIQFKEIFTLILFQFCNLMILGTIIIIAISVFEVDKHLGCYTHILSFLFLEAEKELSAMDDIIFAIFVFFFIFGGYFGSNFLFSFLARPEFVLLVYIMPLFFSFLFGLPLNLLFDFGLSFLVFLRGGAASASFILETIFDYIGVLAFFIRLIVQLVRLIVMFFIFTVMHDAVIIEMSDFTSDFIKTSFWEDFNNLLLGNESASYFFLINFPQRIIYWIYEVIHTFFVVTVQFSAFFVIAFWLFLLFYTFFVFEKFENHFKFLRKKREMNKKIFFNK